MICSIVTYDYERSRVLHALNVKLREHLSSDDVTMTLSSSLSFCVGIHL